MLINLLLARLWDSYPVTDAAPRDLLAAATAGPTGGDPPARLQRAGLPAGHTPERHPGLVYAPFVLSDPFVH